MSINEKTLGKKNNQILTFTVCFSSIALVFLGHYIGVSLLILFSVGIMCCGIIFLPYDKKISILFCALPWMQVLKLNSEQPTYYHLLYFVFVLVLLKDTKKVNIKMILFILLFISYVFFVRLLNHSNLELGFIAYVISIIFMVLFYPNIKKYYNLTVWTNMFSFGLITGFIAERVYRTIPSMNMYLSSDSYAHSASAIRYAGLSNDSNFMALQVLMYLCLIFKIIDSKISSSINKILLILSAVIVTFFTLFTVSKMFFLGILIIAIYYFINNLWKLNLKVIISFLVLSSIVIYISYSLGFLNGIIYRLNSIDSVRSLTTGRSDIIGNYQNLFLTNGSITLFGIGMIDRAYFQETSTHNTLITGIYQLGIIGLFFIYLPMIIQIIKSAKLGIFNVYKRKNYLSVIILGLCMMTLDIFMYEGLPLLILIVIVCLSKDHSNVYEKGDLNAKDISYSTGI